MHRIGEDVVFERVEIESKQIIDISGTFGSFRKLKNKRHAQGGRMVKK